MATRNRLATEEETEGVNALAARVSPGTQYGAAPATNLDQQALDVATFAARFPEQLAALGWTGPSMVPTGETQTSYAGSDTGFEVPVMGLAPGFADFVRDKGLSISLKDMGFATSDIALMQNNKPIGQYQERPSGLEKIMNPVMDYGVPLFLASLTGQAIGGLAGSAANALAPATSTVTNALTPAAIEAGLGTAGYGANAAAASSGLFNPAAIGAGSALPFEAMTTAAAPSLTAGAIPSALNPTDILASQLPEVAAAPLPTPAALAPELAAPVAAPPRLTPAALEAGIGTPGYGTNASAVQAGITPSAGFAGMSPTDFGMSGAQTAAYDTAIAAGATPEAALAASNAAPVLGSPAATAATTAAATGASAVTNPYQFLIPAASNIVGAVIGAQATKSATEASGAAATRAAELQYQAQKEALDLQRRMYEENVARQQPYYQAGVNALAQLPGRTGAMPPAFQFRPEQLTTDPGYGFRLSEGLKALERSAAARGGLLSGGTGKALTRFGQEMGSQEFGNAYNRALTEYNALRQREGEEYNRLAGLAGVGGTTAQQLGQAGQAYGQQTGNLLTGTAANVGNLLTQQGQNMANAAIARGSLYGRGLSDIGYLAGQYYGRPPGP